jgi:phosphoglycolate phosphatase-like HAD superfamily hydrolase
MLKCIVFDFDGVIVESCDVKTNAFRRLFQDYPEHLEAIVKLHLDNGGMPRFEKFRIIYQDFLNKSLSEAECRELGSRFSELVLDAVVQCPFVRGAVEFLENIDGRIGLYVASGTPHEELQEIVRRRGLESFFRGVYGSPDSKAVILKRIMREQGLRPEEVVLVGDAFGDFQNAQEVAVHFIGRAPKDLPNPFPSDCCLAIVEDLQELGSLWQGLQAD